MSDAPLDRRLDALETRLARLETLLGAVNDKLAGNQLNNFGAFLSGQQKEELKNIDPKMEIDGDNATTRVEERPLEGEVRLKKEGGEWRISTR